MGVLFAASLCGIVTWATYLLYRLVSRNLRRRGVTYPPGPPGVPLLGNIQLPSGLSWKVYDDWAKEYGSDILYLNALGNDVIILNSIEAAKALLEKKSAIYSDRPVAGLTFLGELCGLSWSFALQPYGSEWRDGRKAFQREFHPSAVVRFQQTEIKEARKLLLRLLNTPAEFMLLVRKMTGSSIISIAYGIETLEDNDPYVATAEHTMEAVNASLVPGAFLVDLFPVLKYIPEWVPGASFQKKARIWRESVMRTLNAPWTFVQERMTSDPMNAPDSVAKSLIEGMSEYGKNLEYTERVAKSVVASMYLASSDTTLSIIWSFFLAMVLYPDVQRRAQGYLDKVCPNRLPDFSDYDSLPYIHAIVKECLRWHPVAALNVPHSSTEDDVYRGYYIPKGSTVVVNNWAILHDPAVYQNPESFMPERFLKFSAEQEPTLLSNSETRDPMDVAFGFGRRICPGRYMAYESMWVTIVSVLAVFTIEKAKGKDGELVVPLESYCDGFVSQPLPFSCAIVPRSPAHKALILDI